MSNPCLIVTKDGELVQSTAPLPECGENQVLVHVKCTGICGTDIHLWKEHGVGDLRISEDLIIGHECAGQVVKIGSKVNSNLSIGDRVAIEPQFACNECYLCSQGDYNLCLNVDFLGMPGMPGRAKSYHGSMQRYLPIRPQNAHKIPDTMSYQEGALVEVFSVGYHGIEKAGGLDLGVPALVAGCGPIGLATLMLADAAGASPLAVVDVSQERLELAKRFVPSVLTYKVDPKLSAKENAQHIRLLFGTDEGQMPKKILECTGVESSINTCAYVVRRTGVLTIVGVSCKNEINDFPFMPLSFGEVDVRFINRYHALWPPVINLISSGKIDAKKLVTHSFDLNNAKKALETTADPQIPTMKVMVEDHEVDSKL